MTTLIDTNGVSRPIYLTDIAGTPVVVSSIGGISTGGDIASGTTDSGNPIKIGGRADSGTPTAVTTGQRVNAWFGPSGQLITGGGQISAIVDTATGVTVPISNTDGLGRPLAAANYLWTGSALAAQRSMPGASSSGIGTASVGITPHTVASGALARVATTTAQSGLVVKASAGNLYGYNVVSGASAGYLMIFDSVTVPADGAVTPLLCIPLAANAGITSDRDIPIRFATGISMCFSTTGPFTKTASATAFLAGDAA